MMLGPRPVRSAPTAGWRPQARLGCFCAGLLALAVAWPAPLRAAGDDTFLAELVARSFFAALFEGRPAAAEPLCADAVSFEGEQVRGKQAIAERLTRLSQRARQKNLALRRITVLTSVEARRLYGPPPARLGSLVRPPRRVALARFNQLGAVLVLDRQGGLWRVVGLTD